MMSALKNGNILYGGPLPPVIDDHSRSLGEIVLKLLTENQDDVMFVSVNFSKLIVDRSQY